jgi:hypothetical protein
MPPARPTRPASATELKQMNIKMDPDLFYKAKAKAVEERTTLRSAIARMLQDYVRQPAASRPAPTKPAPGRPRPRPRPKDDDEEED